MLTYTLDAARAREGALASAWATLCASNLGLLLTRAPFPPGRPVGLCVLAAAFNAATLMLTGEGGREGTAGRRAGLGWAATLGRAAHAPFTTARHPPQACGGRCSSSGSKPTTHRPI